MKKYVFIPGDKVVLACNTIHLLYDDLFNILDATPVSLIKVTVRSVKSLQTIGILATPTTIRTKLYENPLNSAGVQVMNLNITQQQQIEEIIRSVIANQVTDENIRIVTRFAENLINQGAQKIILGCTELSVLMSDHLEDIFIDPLKEILPELRS